MSITLMAAAWDLEIDSTEKMVLMCLCDHASDDGQCWPSVATIMRKCSKSERTVQSSLKWLKDNGFFTFIDKPGRGRLYRLNPRKICTPAKSAPPQNLHLTPADSAPHPRKSRTQTINEPPVTSISIPPTPKSRGKKVWQSSVVVPDWVPSQQWADFIAMRVEKGKAPTDRAIELLFRKLDQMRASGQDPGAVLNKSTMNNWTDIYPLKDQADGNRNHQTAGSPPSGNRGSGNRADGFTAAINDALDRPGPDPVAAAAGRWDDGHAAGDRELPLATRPALR